MLKQIYQDPSKPCSQCRRRKIFALGLVQKKKNNSKLPCCPDNQGGESSQVKPLDKTWISNRMILEIFWHFDVFFGIYQWSNLVTKDWTNTCMKRNVYTVKSKTEEDPRVSRTTFWYALVHCLKVWSKSSLQESMLRPERCKAAQTYDKWISEHSSWHSAAFCLVPVFPPEVLSHCSRKDY